VTKYRCVCFADTHEMHNRIEMPEGDFLFFAGDMSYVGSEAAIRDFGKYIRNLPHRHKVITGGNHDKSLEHQPISAKSWLGFGTQMQLNSCYYLEHETIEIEGLKIFSSPFSPEFFPQHWSFQLRRGNHAKKMWSKVKLGTHIVISHGPAFGILDYALGSRDHVGCEDLYNRLLEVQPVLHVTGHLHESRAVTQRSEFPNTLFVNASICTVDYKPTNKPIVVDLIQEGGKWRAELIDA